MEEVVVEADGEWHTEDSKYGSAGWMSNRPASAILPSVKASPAPSFSRKPSPTAEPLERKPDNVTNGADLNGKKKEPEVFVLDDDDSDDEGVPLRKSDPFRADSSFNDRRPSSSNLTPGSSSVPRQTPVLTNAGVIDLTGLDSDDEDREPPQKTSAGAWNGQSTGGFSPSVPTLNGNGVMQNRAKRRRTDDLMMEVFGSGSDYTESASDSDRENLLFSPTQRGRRVVFDDQDPVPKRARLSGGERIPFVSRLRMLLTVYAPLQLILLVRRNC